MRFLLERIEAALVVRDPGTARSVDAYEGLRRQVVAAASERRRLLVILSEMSEALRLGNDASALKSKIEEWMLQAGLVSVTDGSVVDAFDVDGAAGGTLEVTVPAYVDTATGQLIRRGFAERRLDTTMEPVGSAVEPVNDAALDASSSSAEEGTSDDGQTTGEQA